MVNVAKPTKAQATRSETIQQSNSTKVTALNLLKSGVRPVKVSKDLKIPDRTLRQWRKESMEAGTWAGGDTGLARPAKRKTGSGGHNRKMTDEIKKKIKRKLQRNPFLTSHGLQVAIPELRQVSRRAISHQLSPRN